MVAAGLFKQGVLQFFCFKMLVRKCKEFLWFVFCSHIRVREEDVSLQGCCCMEAGSSRSVLLFGMVTWRGAVCLLCDLWNVLPCPSLSLVWL